MHSPHQAVPTAKRRITPEQEKRYQARAHAKYERDAKRVLATRFEPRIPHNEIDAALNLMFPWRNASGCSRNPYPGHTACILAVFEARVSLSAIKGWRTGKLTPAKWAFDTLAARLEREAKERWAIAKKLRELANKKATP